MKHKLSLIDVYKLTEPLKVHCAGKRVNTIYSISNKTILIKLADKSKILIDIGNKIYLTSYDAPTTVKTHKVQILLRQHLLNRIILDIVQVNCDRIIDIYFNLDYKLRIELYGSGDMIFSKSDEVLYQYQQESIKKDPELKTELHLCTREQLKPFLETTTSKTAYNKFLADFDYGKDINTLILSKIQSIDQLDFLHTLNESLVSNSSTGYIYYNQISDPLLVDDIYTVSPIPLHLEKIEKEFSTFSEALDTYFSQIEQAKVFQKQESQKNALKKKRLIMESDQQRRIQELTKEIEYLESSANCIQQYTNKVSRVLELVNNALATGMDWSKVKSVLELDKIRFPELKLINSFDFDKKIVVLLIDSVKVVMDLTKTDFGNVQSFYEKRKHIMSKLSRTEDAYKHTLKSIDKSITKENKKIESFFRDKHVLKRRIVFWFEKFHWFITSDHYLCIAGRDSHQNELLVKRYLRKGDLYIHADLNGSPSCIIKGHPNKSSIPSRSLAEAGSFTVCLSKAWDAKIVSAAYFVYPSQVSQTAQTGEYLKTGSFMIRGKKNYLPPVQLVLGFGVLFKLTLSIEKAQVEVDEVSTIEPSSSSGTSTAAKANIFEQSQLNKIETTEVHPVIQDLLSTATPSSKPASKVFDQPKTQEIKKKKRSKKSKKAQKYKDQDEDEKEIALRLLQGKLTSPIDQVKSVEIKNENSSSPAPVYVPTKTQEEYDMDKIKEADSEMGEFGMLDKLSGQPGDNEIEYALTVCAPYEVMKNYKYKVKLTPGTEKKGKSAKMALSLFLENKEINETEKAVVKVLNIDDMIRTIPNKSKVSAPNLQSIKKKNKSKKKSK